MHKDDQHEIKLVKLHVSTKLVYIEQQHDDPVGAMI